MQDFIKELKEAIKRVVEEDEITTLDKAKHKIEQLKKDIEILSIHQYDQKRYFQNELHNALKIRYTDFMKYKNLNDNKVKAEALEITLEKIFEVLENAGITFNK